MLEDKELREIERKNSKNTITLYMKYSTKNELKKLALNKGISQGQAIDLLLETYYGTEKKESDLARLTKENNQLLKALKEQNEITNILLKELLKEQK